MSFSSLHQILEILIGGPDASMSARIVRAGLVLCTFAAIAQLLTMLSTSWGDRHQIGKSFTLSLLVHLCLGLSWVTVVQSNPIVTNTDAELAEIPIQVTLTQDSSSDSDPSSSYPGLVTTSHSSTGISAPQRSQQRSSLHPRDNEPATFRDDRQPVARPMEAASFTSNAATPKIPDQIAMNTDRRLPAPVTNDEMDDSTPQSRSEATASAPSRRPISRGLPKMAEVSPNKDLPSQATVQRPVTTVASLPVPSISMARSESPQVVAAPAAVGRSQPKPRTSDSDVRAESVVKGIVTDRKTGRPVARTTVRFDRIQGKPLLAVTREDGSYELILPDTPDTFAITAVQGDYLPEARNIRSIDVKGKTHRVDFSLRTATEDTIAVESNPHVHHLGNDQFEGVANSKFQRKSEGHTFTQTFTVGTENLLRSSQQPVVTFLAKGVQCPPQVRINGRLLRATEGLSPADGAYGTLAFSFDPALLKVGENEVSVTASTCQGDLDDFEFVNIQIRLSKSK